MRAARAARLFSLGRPIKFLTCGVVVAVPVIDAKAPYFLNLFCTIALGSCIAALAVIFALFVFSFASLYNTLINSNHNYDWFATRLWLHFYCIDVRY